MKCNRKLKEQLYGIIDNNIYKIIDNNKFTIFLRIRSRIKIFSGIIESFDIIVKVFYTLM